MTVDAVSAVPAQSFIVDGVAEGYTMGISEYSNDLSCRKWLAATWPLVTERVRTGYAGELMELDEKFRAVTVEDGGSTLGHTPDNPPVDWWERRRPVILLGELAEDFERILATGQRHERRP